MREWTRKAVRETTPDASFSTHTRTPLDMAATSPLVLDGEILPPIPSRRHESCACTTERSAYTTRRPPPPRSGLEDRPSSPNQSTGLVHPTLAPQPPPRVYAERKASSVDIALRGTTAVATATVGLHSGRMTKAAVRSMSTGLLVALLMASTSEFILPVESLAGWTAAFEAKLVAALDEPRASAHPAFIPLIDSENRRIGTLDTTAEKAQPLSVSVIVLNDIAEKGGEARPPATLIELRPALDAVHVIELPQIEMSTLPALPDRAAVATAAGLLDLSVQSMSVAASAPSWAATIASTAAQNWPVLDPVPAPSEVTPAVVVSAPTAGQSATRTIAAAAALLEVPTAALAKASPVVTLASPSNWRPVVERAPVPKRIAGATGTSPGRDAVAPTVRSRPTPVPMTVAGSLKDPPVVRAGVVEAGGTLVTSGAVALTAYRGAIAQPKPVFLSQPLLSDMTNGHVVTGRTPSWARAWLVDRMDPGEAFRTID